MKRNNILLLIVLCLLCSCDDVIDVDVKKEQEALVVEGWLTNQDRLHYVKLYKTIPFFNKPEFPPVQHAVVTLKDNAGHTEVLEEAEPGIYSIRMRGRVGRIYTLSIQSDVGEYEAVTEMKRLGTSLDSVTYVYKEKSVLYENPGYYPLISGQEKKGKGDYLLLKIARNGSPLLSARDINLFSDEFVDGNYIKQAEVFLKDPLQKDDIIYFEGWSLTEDAFRFWLDIQTQLRNGGIFSVPATNTRTNVVKLTSNSLNVTGYFGASAVVAVDSRVK
ncbi:DUF4249 domain-containing protein [Rubrolithibacter danxiaensis]|uniref:DUF4249 domain-containing protein n=1 Tax=Rubrolithibacter danxiaensis TaxID=3390805 RepID=UPI003BF78A9E